MATLTNGTKRAFYDYARCQWVVTDGANSIIKPDVLGRYESREAALVALNG